VLPDLPSVRLYRQGRHYFNVLEAKGLSGGGSSPYETIVCAFGPRKQKLRCEMEYSKAAHRFPMIVRKYRLQQSISQQMLAEAAGIDRTYVGLIERGLRKPTLDVAERISAALGKSLSSMITEAEQREVGPSEP
jgi:DNA-binding XRE family transcriptional regulator